MSARLRLSPEVELWLSRPCTVYVAVKYADGHSAMLDLDNWSRDQNVGKWVESKIVNPREHAREMLTRAAAEDTGSASVRIVGEDAKAPAK